jgi:hypothetical protein
MGQIFPPLHLQGRGTAEGGGGASSAASFPSTRLRLVPLPRKSGGGNNCLRLPIIATLALTLAACADQVGTAVAPGSPGFLYGLWHGFIFPIAWILSLFMDDVAIYAVPNNGGWYDFGYFLGIVVFGVGARKSHVVYRDRVERVRD